jgi:hypothetical protein
MLHGNVCPANVLVTDRLMWKLAGLAFAIYPLESTGCSSQTNIEVHKTAINDKRKLAAVATAV